MLLAIDPLIAAGVVLATAATDAVYVMFTSAVVAQTGACGKLEQRLVSALVFRGDPLHRELGLRGFRGRWLVDWGVRHHELHASTDRRSAGRCRTRLTPGDRRLVHQQSLAIAAAPTARMRNLSTKASRRSGSNLLTVTYNMKATHQIANT